MTDDAPDPAFTVACPDCYSPAGTPCLGHHDVHASRTDVARLRSTDRGTCALCGQLMIRDATGDAWHPTGALTTPCPVLPDPQRDWEAYAAAINTGLEPGRPGREHFRPNNPCPECVNGKCVNCTGDTLDLVTDDLTPCTCTHPAVP